MEPERAQGSLVAKRSHVIYVLHRTWFQVLDLGPKRFQKRDVSRTPVYEHVGMCWGFTSTQNYGRPIP